MVIEHFAFYKQKSQCSIILCYAKNQDMFKKLFRKKPQVLILDADAPIHNNGLLTETFGIKIYDGSVAPFALLGEPYPNESSYTFSTTEDNQQSISLSFYRGIDRLAEDCKFLGEYQLEGYNLAPAEEPVIRLFFRLKSNKIELWAKDENEGNKISITMVQNSNWEIVQ